MAKLTPS